MRSLRSFFLILCGLIAVPPSLHATPENTAANYFNPTLIFDLTPRADDKNSTRAQALLDKISFTASKPVSVDDYVQSTFEYLNRRLNLTNKDYSLKPMIGFDLFRSYSLSSGFTLVPEIYAVYRYDAVDDNVESRLLSRDALQAGLALGLKTAGDISATLRFDSDLQPGARDHRLLLAIKHRW